MGNIQNINEMIEIMQGDIVEVVEKHKIDAVVNSIAFAYFANHLHQRKFRTK